MWVFYICALIPILVGAIFLFKNKEIVWWEWLVGAAASFALAGILHLTALWGMTADVETWSGHITKVSHHPKWVERYTETHSETDSKGNTRTWTTTEYDTHHEEWVAHRDFGTEADTEIIEENEFNEIGRLFGGKLFEDGKQDYNHFDGSVSSGDNNVYSIDNLTARIEPVTTLKSFENRIKASPTVFSFASVPTNITVHSWPANNDWRHSDRLVGTASVLVDQYKWDCMNTFLGPKKRVNVIMVGFGDKPSDYGQWQQAKWIGGKKNDLVLCFGGATKARPAQWAYVFGWTESELVKNNLKSILMEYPVNDDIIPYITAEIIKNYQIKDWHKFDYIAISPPTWSYWLYFVSMLITQGGLYYFFHVNEYGKCYGSYRYGRSVRW